MAFYVHYADENGLTISRVNQRISRWDMTQWKQALDDLRAVKIPLQASDHIKYAMATAGINREYLLMSIIAVRMAVATAKQHALVAKRLAQDVTEEVDRKAEALKLAERRQDYINRAHKMRREVYDTYVKDSFKDASKQWSPRLWQDNEEMTRKVQNIVSQHLTSGLSIDDFTHKLFPYSEQATPSTITGSVDSMDYKAQRLLRTESARAINEVNRKIYEIADIDEVDVVNEPGACPKCVDIADKGPYRLKEAPGIPIHPNCRCSLVPHDDFIFMH